MILENLTAKTKNIILVVVFTLAIFLITFDFKNTPKVWVDEGVFTETAKNLATHGVLGLQTSTGEFFSMRNFLLSTSYPVILPVALSFKILGTGIVQARLPMILYMFALVMIFYLFAKKRYSFYPAILSVLMLLSFSPFYGNGRPVQGEVPGLVFLVLGALFLLYLEESGFNDKKWAVLSGLAFGLAASTKPIFLVLIPLALVITLFFWIKKIENRKILLFLLTGLIIPILIWCYIHISTAALFITFISKSFFLASNHDMSSISFIQNILNNIIRFSTESTPILFILMFGIVALTFLIKFRNKISQTLSSSEFIIFSFIILNWITYLTGTGWYRYFFPAHVLLYLLFPAYILALSQIINKRFYKKVLILIPIMLIIFQFYHLIFLSDTSFVVERTRNTDLKMALSEIDTSQKILFYNTIETSIFLRGDNYSQYLSMGDFLEAGNKNVTSDSNFGYILTNNLTDINFNQSCYISNPVDRYTLLKKIKDCK